MKIFGRQIPVKQFPGKVAGVITIVYYLFKWCSNPVTVLKAYFLRKGLDSIRLRNGYRIFLSSSKHDISTFIVIFCKKEYGILQNQKTVVDVGTNIGMFSMYAFCCGADKVYGFEPNKESFATIQKTIAANKLENRWLVVNAGVAATSGGFLYIPKKSSPGNVAIKDAGMHPDLYDTVPTISLDDFIGRHQISHIDLLKVDCEGGEYEMLPSLKPETIRNIRQIKLEFHGSETPVRDWFQQHHFTITKYWLSPDEKNLGYLWADNRA